MADCDRVIQPSLPAHSFGFFRSLVCSRNFSWYQNSTEATIWWNLQLWVTYIVGAWASNRTEEDKPDTATQGNSFSLTCGLGELTCRLRLKWSPDHQTEKPHQEPNGEGLQADGHKQCPESSFGLSVPQTTQHHQCNCSRELGGHWPEVLWETYKSQS